MIRSFERKIVDRIKSVALCFIIAMGLSGFWIAIESWQTLRTWRTDKLRNVIQTTPRVDYLRQKAVNALDLLDASRGLFRGSAILMLLLAGGALAENVYLFILAVKLRTPGPVGSDLETRK